jgi:histidine phosphotransfer protein HptB
MIMMSNTTKPNSKPEEIISIMREWLSETLGDAIEFMLPELATMFLEDAPDMLSKIHSAIANQNAASLKEFAHTLKGSSASMGLQTLASLCQEIETMAKAEDLKQAPITFNHLKQEYAQVKQALEQLTG